MAPRQGTLPHRTVASTVTMINADRSIDYFIGGTLVQTSSVTLPSAAFLNCVSASASQSRAQCRKREFCCKILN